jgi:hypothetical protein
MQKRLTIAILVIISIALMNLSCSRETSMNALILTGQNNHNWHRSSVALQQILEKSGIFTVDMMISPPAGEDMAGFIVDFQSIRCSSPGLHRRCLAGGNPKQFRDLCAKRRWSSSVSCC